MGIAGPRWCAGKMKYWPRRLANKKAAEACARTGARIQAYACPTCGFFHIGHTP